MGDDLMNAVMYGAGNIGRGFIGQLLSMSGYQVKFVDVNQDVIKALNKEGRYPINILYKDTSEEVWVENVSCVDGNDSEAVSNTIANADLMATAVGVNVLKFVAKPLAEGLKKRWKSGNKKPLNIIICENLIGADSFLKGLVEELLNEGEKKLLHDLVGFVEASIGRMVPVQTKEMQKGNILRVCVESYALLPLDKDGFKGEIPKIKNAILYSPFEYYIERKLYIHNMGHAMTAYLGDLMGYEYIWEAIEDPYIELMALRAMTEAAIALSKSHNVDCADIYAHVLDLISRFGNKQLGDTVKRVGNDVRRKLAENDRLIGAYNMCREQGVEPTFISVGIASALCFKHDEINKTMTAESILSDISNLSEYSKILEIKDLLKNENKLKIILDRLK